MSGPSHTAFPLRPGQNPGLRRPGADRPGGSAAARAVRHNRGMPSRPRSAARSSRTARPAAVPPAPTRPSDAEPCPCGLGASYGDCCGALHAGRSAAPTAELLMRSRYAAFAVGDTEYLLRTWSRPTRPRELQLDPGISWTGLDIHGATGGTAFHTEGTVEFTARFTAGGRAGEQHENSRFVREDGAWVYVDEVR